jgi:hypothetical protein
MKKSNDPTYYVGEILNLIQVLEDLPGMNILAGLLDEEFDRYSYVDHQNIYRAFNLKYDIIKRRSLNQGK